MRKDKAGNKLYRKMTVKVIFPDRLFPDRVYQQHAGPKMGFGPEGIDQMLNQIADELDSLYPWWEFKPCELLPIGATIRFAFIFAGNNPNYTPPAPKINPMTESTTPGPETASITLAEAAPEASAISQDTSSQELVQE
jgi:hypothetical protein